MAFTDLFNTAWDNLTADIEDATSLRVVQDPRNINPPCVWVDAPSFDAWNYNIAKITFPVHIIAAGPANSRDALGKLLEAAGALLNANIAVMDGRPSTMTNGGQEFACYDLSIPIQGQTA